MSIEKIIADARARIGAMRIAPPAGAESSNAAAREFELVVEELALRADAIESWSIVEELRAPEGASLTLICDNPDFGPGPNAAVDIVDDWTAWKTRRFGADTVLEALRAAKTVRDVSLREMDRGKPRLCQGADSTCHYPACACVIPAVAENCCSTIEARETCRRLCSNSRLPRP